MDDSRNAYSKVRSKSFGNVNAGSIQMLGVRGRLNSTGHITRRDVETPFFHQPRIALTTDFLRKASQSRQLGQLDLQFAEKLERQNTIRSMSEADKKNLLEEIHEGDDILDHDKLLVEDGFTYNHEGFSDAEAERLLLIHGRNELAENTVPLWYVFISQLWQPMPIMIWCAAAVELSIGNFIDMGILLLIQFANATIGFYEIAKAGDAVAALKASLKPVATVRREGKWKIIDAALVVPGDCVLLASGSAVPADCRLNPRSSHAASNAHDPNIDVDQAALTGESLPVSMFTGDSVKMGSTVVKGEAEGTVEFTGGNTFFGKTASLLQVTINHIRIPSCIASSNLLIYSLL
jgi:magnesium-transporting ATPase (P-type)